MLIFWVPSFIGLLIVVLSCFLTRRPRWLVAALIGGVLLHFFSAAIQYQPYGAEPSNEQFDKARDFARFYFFAGLPLFVAPLLIKFLYVFLRPSKDPSKQVAGANRISN
jgi:hypothetical protein